MANYCEVLLSIPIVIIPFRLFRFERRGSIDCYRRVQCPALPKRQVDTMKRTICPKIKSQLS